MLAGSRRAHHRPRDVVVALAQTAATLLLNVAQQMPDLGLRVGGLGFRIQSSGLRELGGWGVGSKDLDLGYRV